MSTDPAPGESGTDPGLVAPDTAPGPVERPRTSPIVFVIVGTPILVVFGLAIAFNYNTVLMVLVFGGLVGGTVGAVRARRRNQQAELSTQARSAAAGATVGARRRNQQAELSTRARSTAAGATVGLLAAVGVSVVGFVVFAIAMGVILLMALSSWR